MASFSLPLPGVRRTSRPSTDSVNFTPGKARQYWLTRLVIWLLSVAADLRNFSLAGTSRNRCRTVTVVPPGAARTPRSVTAPSRRDTWVPEASPSVRVSSSTWATWAMLCSASPLNPSEVPVSRSARLRILLVAWGWKASSTSSAGMPVPLSDTRMRFTPPPRTSMSMCEAAGVQGVLDELLDHGSGAFHHLAGGDLGDNVRGQTDESA